MVWSKYMCLKKNTKHVVERFTRKKGNRFMRIDYFSPFFLSWCAIIKAFFMLKFIKRGINNENSAYKSWMCKKFSG